MDLTKDQILTIFTIFDKLQRGEKEIIISGKAGTGKTLVLSKLAETFTRLSYDVGVAAFTGKAVSNLVEKIDTSSGSIRITTLHSMLFETKVRYDEKLEKETVEFKKLKPSDIRTAYSLIIVDEAGQLPKDAYDVLSSSDIPVIYFGDKNQLRPIQGGFYIYDKAIDIELNEIVRTKKDNAIQIASEVVLKYGELPQYDYGDEVEFMNKSDITVDFVNEYDPDTILCYTNNERKYYNSLIRAAKFSRYADDLPCKGETIIFLRNSLIPETSIVVFNGMIVELTKDAEEVFDRKTNKTSLKMTAKIGTREVSFHINKKMFFEEELYGTDDVVRATFGYAITVHKAQGSEYDKVLAVLPDEYIKRRMDEYKEFVYTIVTRAKKKLIVAN